MENTVKILQNNKNENSLDEKSFFRVQKIALKFIGFWAVDYASVKIWKIYLAILNAFVVIAAVIFELAFVYENRENLSLMLECLCPLTTKFVTAVKLLIYVWKRNEIGALLEFLQNGYVQGMSITNNHR